MVWHITQNSLKIYDFLRDGANPGKLEAGQRGENFSNGHYTKGNVCDLNEILSAPQNTNDTKGMSTKNG